MNMKNIRRKSLKSTVYFYNMTIMKGDEVK